MGNGFPRDVRLCPGVGVLSMTNVVIGAMTLFSLVFLTSAVSYRFRGLSRVLQASPTILVSRGVLVEARLNR